jgi:FkbM family methyltransferase
MKTVILTIVNLCLLLYRNPVNFFLFIAQFWKHTLILKIGGVKVYHDRSTLWHLVYSYPKIERLAECLPSDIDGAIIDAGANNGLFSVLAKVRFPNNRVYAIEPVYIKSIELNCEKYKIFHYYIALFCFDGMAAFYQSTKSDQIGSVYLSTILEAEKRKNIIAYFHGYTTLKTFITEGKIPKVSLLKLDVQGSELDILQSSIDLFPIIDNILIEITLNDRKAFEIIKILEKHYPYSKTINPVSFGADILFSKNEIK